MSRFTERNLSRGQVDGFSQVAGCSFVQPLGSKDLSLVQIVKINGTEMNSFVGVGVMRLDGLDGFLSFLLFVGLLPLFLIKVKFLGFKGDFTLVDAITIVGNPSIESGEEARRLGSSRGHGVGFRVRSLLRLLAAQSQN